MWILGGAAPSSAAVGGGNEALVMSAGGVLVVKGDDISRLENELKLQDGTVVKPGGTLRRSDGRTEHLIEGQKVDWSGRLGPVPDNAATESGMPDTSAAVKAQ